MTKAEKIAREQIAQTTNCSLFDLWESTTSNNEPHVSTVRGWLMEEIERRFPAQFSGWLDTDAEDDTLRRCCLG